MRQDKTTSQQITKAMKYLLTGFSLIGAFALLALAVGCASYEVRIKESLLSEAGFQTLTPSTQAQRAMYNRMARTHRDQWQAALRLRRQAKVSCLYRRGQSVSTLQATCDPTARDRERPAAIGKEAELK
jgi:hypothetical protein